MKLFTIKEVKDITKLSESTICRLITKGKFPSPVEIGARVRRWREQDVIEWIKKLKNKKYPQSNWNFVVIFYQNLKGGQK